MESKELDDIIKQQAPRLRSFVRGRVSNREDADDIVQDTFYQLLRKMVWQELDKAMAELPEEQRLAIQLTEIEGLSVKDAAGQMNVSVNTFLSRKHYAVLYVRKRMHRLYKELINS